MKIQVRNKILSLLLLIGLPAMAQTPKEQVNCFLDEKIFELTVKDPTLFVPMDRIFIKSYNDDLVAPLLEAGEEQLRIHGSSLNLEIDPESCTITRNDPKRLAECIASHPESPALRSMLGFSYHGISNEGHQQIVSVSREIHLQNMKLTLNIKEKVTHHDVPEQRIVADLELTALVGQNIRQLNLTRDLGEWTSETNRSNWNRCLASP